MKTCYFNTQELCSKFAQLREYISNQDADIFIITKTWHDSSVLDSKFVPLGFKAFRCYRDINLYNEGTYTNTSRVAILGKEDLNPQEYNKGESNAEINGFRLTLYQMCTILSVVVTEQRKTKRKLFNKLINL